MLITSICKIQNLRDGVEAAVTDSLPKGLESIERGVVGQLRLDQACQGLSRWIGPNGECVLEFDLDNGEAVVLPRA